MFEAICYLVINELKQVQSYFYSSQSVKCIDLSTIIFAYRSLNVNA